MRFETHVNIIATCTPQQTLSSILVEDIPFCLKYIYTIKLNMYSVWHNYMFIIIIIIIIIILLLAISFGLKTPSSGQYLQNT